MRIVFGACKTNGKDIWPSRSGFAHEIDVSGLYSGDITIGHMLAYKYTWMFHAIIIQGVLEQLQWYLQLMKIWGFC